jgi:hypothetical protein
MLEEKIENLTKEVVALRQVIEANGLGGGAAAPADAKPAGKAAAAKPAAKKPAAKKVEPQHDADEVGAIMREAAKQSKEDKAAVQAYIAEQECADLAELLTKPELFDAAFDFAQGLLPSDDEDAGDDDEDI